MGGTEGGGGGGGRGGEERKGVVVGGGGVMGLVNIEDSRSVKSGLYKAMQLYCS